MSQTDIFYSLVKELGLLDYVRYGIEEYQRYIKEYEI